MMEAKDNNYAFFKKYNYFLIVIGIVVSIAIGSILTAVFYFNYKIPESDKHPDWPEFPAHTNASIVIEEIGDIEKENQMKPANSDSLSSTNHYKTNIRNITSLGYCILRNEFEYHGVFELNQLRGGGTYQVKIQITRHKPKNLILIRRGTNIFD